MFLEANFVCVLSWNVLKIEIYIFFALKQRNFVMQTVSLPSENTNLLIEKQMSNIPASAFSDTKAHYDLLDGLRGVAALMVIWYHVFEGFAFASNSAIETLNHGYLAVDFFFILSGFVIGYAYDDRWGKSLTMKDFILWVFWGLFWGLSRSAFRVLCNGMERTLPYPW